MRMRLLPFCTLALLAVFPASASPIRLTIALEPAQTLPGIPVTLRVTAVNTGRSPAKLPTWVRMELTSGREPSDLMSATVAFDEDHLVELPLFGDRPWTELDPGETRRFDYIAKQGSPPWLCDERLDWPGTYTLRLVADPVWWGSRWVPPEQIVSNEVELTVLEPTGADAEAWAVVCSHGGSVCRGWWSDDITETLWSRYPDSVYTSWSIPPQPRDEAVAEIAHLQAAVARNPPAGFADVLKQSIARIHISLMDRAVIDDDDAERAFEHSEAARVIFEELANGDTEAYIKAAAQQSLRVDVMTLEELQDYKARIRFVAPPRPHCELAYIADVRAQIAQAASDPAINATGRAKLNAVLRSLDAYTAHATKARPDMSRALQQLSGAVAQIEHADRAHISDDLSVWWQSALANAAALSVKKAIDAAAADASARAKPLAEAKNTFREADEAKRDRKYGTAMRLFQEALDKAENASKARGAFC